MPNSDAITVALRGLPGADGLDHRAQVRIFARQGGDVAGPLGQAGLEIFETLDYLRKALFRDHGLALPHPKGLVKTRACGRLTG